MYSVVNELWTVIHGDMKRQIYHIQKLLTNELDRYKGKENSQVEKHI